MTSNTAQVAWLAGLCEGEAYFGAPGGRPRVRIRMVDRDVVERVAEVVGRNKVQRETYWSDRNPEVKPIYTWVTDGGPAVELMRALLPYMGERRAARIREILGEVA